MESKENKQKHKLLRSWYPAHLSSQWNHILSFLSYRWQYLSPSSSWLSSSFLMMPWRVPLRWPS